MKNNNFVKKQTGGISKLMLIFIMGGLGYSAYLANKKGLITAGSMSSSVSSLKSIASNVGNKLSSNFANDSFSGYGIQLMATQQLDQAKAVMNDFASDGYSAFVLASEAKGRTYYKVRLGPYAQKPEAVAIQDKVIRRYPSNPYVKSSLVIFKPN